MKILVYAHTLEMGGTQINALELGACLRDAHGHDIVLCATPGPLVSLADELKLRFIALPVRCGLPSWSMMRALDDVLSRERPDVVVAWELAQCVEALIVGALRRRVPIVAIDMRSDGVRRELPKTPITTFGTPQLADMARRAGRAHARLLLPPVDVTLNAPGQVDAAAFKALHNLTGADFTFACVSRLTPALGKADSIHRAMIAIQALGRTLPLRLVVVGDGSAMPDLQAQADATNAALGRDAVVLTGEMLDPRPAYAAADVVIGMGSSALRGMAFGKPVLVVGAQGFCELLTPTTAPSFLHGGLWGTGDGDPQGQQMAHTLARLAADREGLATLGEFSRGFVVDHFGVQAVGAQLERHCAEAAAQRPGVSAAAADTLRTLALLGLAPLVPQRIRHWLRRGRAPSAIGAGAPGRSLPSLS